MKRNLEKLIKLEIAIKKYYNYLIALEYQRKKNTSEYEECIELLKECSLIEEKYINKIDITKYLTDDVLFTNNQFTYLIKELIENTEDIELVEKRIKSILTNIGYKNIITGLQSNFVNRKEALEEIEFNIIREQIAQEVQEQYDNSNVTVIDIDSNTTNIFDIQRQIQNSMLTGKGITYYTNENSNTNVLCIFDKGAQLKEVKQKVKALKTRLINYYIQGDINNLLFREIDNLIAKYNLNENIRKQFICYKYSELYSNYIANSYLLDHANNYLRYDLYSVFGKKEVDKIIYDKNSKNNHLENIINDFLYSLNNSFPQLDLPFDYKIYGIILSVLIIKANILIIKDQNDSINAIRDIIKAYNENNESNEYLCIFNEYMSAVLNEFTIDKGKSLLKI